MSQTPTLITYNCEAARSCFPIPFPYGGPQDVCVSVRDSAGSEKTLVYSEDFSLVEHCVIYGAAVGDLVTIWLDAPLARAMALQESRVMAAQKAGLSEERAAWTAEACARVAADACEAARTASINAGLEIEAKAGAETARARTLMDEASARACELAKVASARAVQDIWAAAREAIARAHNPGISAVRSKSDITGYQSGFFVINPLLLNATSFMGMWPAKAEERIVQDGFFVIIPRCPGHDNIHVPDFSTTPGEGIDPGAGNGAGSWWLSCDHAHW